MEQIQQACLSCGKTTQQMTRGLCSKHYQQFVRARKKLAMEDSELEAQRWEAWLIQNGQLLPPDPGRRIEGNVFADLLNEFQSSKPGAITTDSNLPQPEDDEEAIKQAEAVSRQVQAKKAAKGSAKRKRGAG